MLGQKSPNDERKMRSSARESTPKRGELAYLYYVDTTRCYEHGGLSVDAVFSSATIRLRDIAR